MLNTSSPQDQLRDQLLRLRPLLSAEGSRADMVAVLADVCSGAQPDQVSAIASGVGEVVARLDCAKQARESEERLRLLFDNLAEAVFFVGLDGRVQTWTPAAQRMFGYEDGEVVGMDTAHFFPESRRAKGDPNSLLREAALHGKHTDEDVRLRKNGSAFWAQVTTCTVRDPEGHVTGFAEIVRDLSLAHEAQEARERYTRTLELSNRDLDQYASVASHDLQEPLRKILTYVDRAQTRGAQTIDAQTAEYLARAQAAARRMQTLVGELLAYARITGRMKVQRVNLNDIARGVLSDLEAQIERTGAQVNVGTLPTLDGDALQLRQLLQNLLGNALKFHAPGATPTVSVEATELPGRLHPARGVWVPQWALRISDNGIGFDPRYASKIFEMLKRLHPREAYEGSGMGLAICHRIVHQHDGTITAHGAPGGGSTFTVVLPGTQSRGEEP